MCQRIKNPPPEHLSEYAKDPHDSLRSSGDDSCKNVLRSSGDDGFVN